MATKMNEATAKRVKALKINAKNEEEARAKLLEILVENGIEDMEEEETDTLLDIAESFVEDDNSGDDEEQTEEEENDELAEEVEEEEEEEEPKKSAKKASKKVEEPEEEEDDEEETEDEDEGDEFAEMDRTALKAYIKDNELDITVKKSMTDDDIRDLIRAEVGEEEEEDEKPAPKSKASTKTAEKAAPKKEDKKAAAPAKSEKKAEKKETKPAADKRGTKLDPKNNEDDREVFDALKELFPEDEYVYAWVASAGVTIKHKGKNSQRSMVLIENCSKQADGSIKCNLYLLTFTKQTEVLDEAGIDYEKCWSGAPLVKGITLDEAVEIITGLMEQITATVKKIDKRLGDNRKKMEENLDKKKPAKK